MTEPKSDLERWSTLIAEQSAAARARASETEAVFGLAKILTAFIDTYVGYTRDPMADSQILQLSAALDPRYQLRPVDNEFYEIIFSDKSSIVFAYEFVPV